MKRGLENEKNISVNAYCHNDDYITSGSKCRKG
jgi:hypothetical protein